MPRYTSKQLAQVLRETRGMVYVASKRLGCSDNTLRARLAREPQLQAVVDSERELTNDLVELKLLEAALRGEPWAVQFFLRTRARDRGYGDRQEITGNQHLPLSFSLRVDRGDGFDFDAYGKAFKTLFDVDDAGALASSNGVVHDDH